MTKITAIHVNNYPETVTPDYDPESIKQQFTESYCHDSESIVVGIASWNYFSLGTAIHIAIADMNFVPRSPSLTLIRNFAIPTYFWYGLFSSHYSLTIWPFLINFHNLNCNISLITWIKNILMIYFMQNNLH